MIVRHRPGLAELLFATRGSVVTKAAPRVAAMAAWSAAVAAAALRWPAVFAPLSPAPFTLFGIALSIFMSFRNSACYDRWWEGRKLWGQIVVECRALGRQSEALPRTARERVLRDACGFAHALAAQLREGDATAAGRPWTTATLDRRPNIPDALLADAGSACLAARRDGEIDAARVHLLEERLTALSVAQAGCERIRATPVPFAYSLLLHRTAYLFCLLLPFGLAHGFGFMTPGVVAVIAYAFFGLDALSEELEEPFGLDANDLPLDALVRGIERDMLSALGETELPPVRAPQNYLLT